MQAAIYKILIGGAAALPLDSSRTSCLWVELPAPHRSRTCTTSSHSRVPSHAFFPSPPPQPRPPIGLPQGRVGGGPEHACFDSSAESTQQQHLMPRDTRAYIPAYVHIQTGGLRTLVSLLGLLCGRQLLRSKVPS